MTHVRILTRTLTQLRKPVSIYRDTHIAFVRAKRAVRNFTPVTGQQIQGVHKIVVEFHLLIMK
jgi:hypothetical protein